MTILTKHAAEVFAPTTAGGAPRGASMAEAQTWGTEIEALFALMDLATESVRKTTAGNVTVTTERYVFIDKVTPQATTVTLPLPDDRVGGMPITVHNVGGSVDYISNPTTLSVAGGTFSRTGTSTMVMDGAEQHVTLVPIEGTTKYAVIGG